MSTDVSATALDLIARWPKKLIDRIHAQDWVLVVGAGLSRHASNGDSAPVSWRVLIERLAAEYADDETRRAVTELITLGQYLDAAEIIKQCAVADGKETDFRESVKVATDGPSNSPFKPSDIHRQIFNELEPLLIITTNYDRLLERASEHAYGVHRPGDTNLGADIRTGSPALVKPHGTVDDLGNIVLTRSDYATIRHRSSELYKVMDAIFLTKTCLFIGYSFQDPDLLLLLENSFAGKNQPGAHYWLAPDDAPGYLKRMYQQHYGVEMIQYAASTDHSEMRLMIEALCFSVSSSRS